MLEDAIQSSRVKLRILEQFYGLEEYLDMPEALPDMLTKLDAAQSEFCLITSLSNLDIWFVRITNQHNKEVWNPFNEPLVKYAKRHALLTAHLYPQKQWPNNEILRFLNVRVTK